MDYIARSASNPFGMKPPCDQFVPGYGASTADFHVIGDHPGVHGGTTTGVPFTDREWSTAFFDLLESADFLLAEDPSSGEIESPNTFFSYLYACVPEGAAPTEREYEQLEPFFDAELRAITAHVLLPVGSRATAHVFREYTAIDPDRAADMDAVHATECRGSGWLILPIKEPAEWTAADAETLASALRRLRDSDYEQLSDLGRFKPDGDPYFVR